MTGSEFDNVLCRLWERGVSPAQIAAHLGVDYKRVYRRGRALGLPKVRSDRHAQYMDCLMRGLTMRETADELGVNYHAVNLWKQRTGLQFRPARGGENWSPPGMARPRARPAEAEVVPAHPIGRLSARQVARLAQCKGHEDVTRFAKTEGLTIVAAQQYWHRLRVSV